MKTFVPWKRRLTVVGIGTLNDSWSLQKNTKLAVNPKNVSRSQNSVRRMQIVT